MSQVGKDSYGIERTLLLAAAANEHFQIVKYLIEQGEADPNIALWGGNNALHYAAGRNEKNTELIKLLLTNMPLNIINKKAWDGETPLDRAYKYNESPIKQAIIDLIRSKGGKANYYYENGRHVGEGGDLNDEDNNRVTTTTTATASSTSNSSSSKMKAKKLHKEYKKEFPKGTPIVVACEKGRFEDVKVLLYYCHYVNGFRNGNNMTSHVIW